MDMDWDDIRPTPAKAFAAGDVLDALSIAELEGRVKALESEIVRVKAEIDKKRRQADAANAFFK